LSSLNSIDCARIARSALERYAASSGRPLHIRRNCRMFCSGVFSWETPSAAAIAKWLTAFSSERCALRTP
jgi:hypothetical protein